MKKDLIPSLLCFFIAAGALSTCESKFGSKVKDRNNMPPQLGHPYSGVVSAVAGICVVRAPWIAKPQAVVLAPLWLFTVLSAPAVLLTDTLVLPIDLYFVSEVQRISFAKYCSYYAQDHLQVE